MGANPAAGQRLSGKIAHVVANGLNAGSNHTDRKNALEQGVVSFAQAVCGLPVRYCIEGQFSLSTNERQI